VFLLFFGFAQDAFAGDPFMVRGVHVDAQASNALEAQTLAIAQGQGIAANILINRMSLDAERLSKGFTGVTNSDGAKMIRALEIANERRSATRYLGDIDVAFNQNAVAQYMRIKGLTLVSSQSRQRLVIPVLEGENPWADNKWARAWQAGQLENALTPMQAITPKPGLESVILNINDANIDIKDLQAIGRAFGVEQILIAEARQGYEGYTVTLKDIALDTKTTRRLGPVTGFSAKQAVVNVVAALEDEWKASAVSSVSSASVILPVSVLYRSHAEWQQLQDVINGSAQIRSARLEAISKRGTLMTLTYGGDMERLRNELAYKGVSLKQDEKLGMVLSRTGAF